MVPLLLVSMVGLGVGEPVFFVLSQNHALVGGLGESVTSAPGLSLGKRRYSSLSSWSLRFLPESFK